MPAPSLTGFNQKVIVGIAEMVASNNQNVTLTTYSLGSCLGIAIYDQGWRRSCSRCVPYDRSS